MEDDVGGPDAPLRATARALAKVGGAEAVVLVEGVSDQIAVEAAAVRSGFALDAERVVVVPIGGAHAIGRFLTMFDGVRLAGLCDLNEQEVVRGAPRPAVASALRTTSCSFRS